MHSRSIESLTHWEVSSLVVTVAQRLRVLLTSRLLVNSVLRSVVDYGVRIQFKKEIEIQNFGWYQYMKT